MDMEEETAMTAAQLPLQRQQQQQESSSHHQSQTQSPSSPSSPPPPQSLKNKPRLTFLLVAFCLGELGDGLNIFQGIYLVLNGWNEGSVGAALSLMGFVSLLVTPFAGDLVDKTNIDRRFFLAMASIITGLSASAILFVHTGNQNADHWLIFGTKTIEGLAASFIMPCLAALTLANFGPRHFDSVYAWMLTAAHLGSVAAAILAGAVAYFLYPNIKYCFLVIGASAILAIFFIQYLPQGDVLMGRGFQGKVAMDELGQIERLDSDETTVAHDNHVKDLPPTPASYWQVFFDFKTCLLCLTGFFFHFANANVLLVLGELMGGDEDGSPRRSAIPLVAGAIVTAQITMALSTWMGDRLTFCGVGRKPLFMLGLVTLPIRCALIICWKDAGDAYLLSTQLLDGLGGGLCGLVHPYLVADLTFGTGRFNVVMGLTASFFGLGATLSNFLGQIVVEMFGHVTSLLGSLVLSIVPIILFSTMPETLGQRETHRYKKHVEQHALEYSSLA